ncbi:30S ribosomal protein S5 alanine N-acetyltransferase [Corallococcus sp. H22C18031201]|uniref:GNAT family N-acetyltransferase n=1 Tax=Citreicoccus inhibens TaxID=2849499 RepID=UPI000E720738|nr:GNAT family N-acetyltransferase [Citreicoccus inhibens]MBU8895696.1 GNAT family N-acetyltransferase [Citreicoccus inhibens]RJS20121.1 30S ribosomal protein S5 alanine N-acetyltransferase [Corallococcus sp. H22C18031201]
MTSDSPPLLLTTERLHVTQLPSDAAARVLAYYDTNREHLGAVSPTRPATFFSTAYWRTRLAQDREDFRHDISLRLYVLPRDAPPSSAPVIGNISLTHIRRGPLQAADLGYGLDRNHTGHGFMTEALRAVCDYAFSGMGLHRLQANHLPENLKSAAVLRRLGFAVEGYARDFLLIDGHWRDHVLTSLVAPPEPGLLAGP